MKKYFYLSFTVFFLLIAVKTNAATFNYNNIISDEEMLDSDSMTLAEIDSFLKRQGGYIANQTFTDAFGNLKTAAEIIYNAAHNYDCEDNNDYKTWTDAQKQKYCEPAEINPKLLLVLLQKEQSLLDHTDPSQKRLDWATGYGVCDNCSMSDPAIQRFKGFGKQINSAALQFFDYMKNPENYKYKAGYSYTVSNTDHADITIKPNNQATAALYNYTPHVYYGNYNFFKLWMKYFTFNYPNGTLMQAKGEDGVWLIQDGYRRPFLSKGALTSRFDPEKIVNVNKSDLEKYPIGDAIKFPQYSLVRSPRGTVFLLVDDTRRGFASAEALRVIGINPEEIIDAEWEDINVYEEGTPVTATSTYATGALLQDNSTGGIFYVSDGTKAPLWDAILLKTKYKNKSITPVSTEKLASYKTVDPAIFSDGELLKDQNSAAVYIIDDGKKRLITSGEIFETLGYKWSNVIPVPKKILDLYPEGEYLSEIYTEENFEIENEIENDETATSTITLNEDTKATSTIDTNLENEINSILNP